MISMSHADKVGEVREQLTFVIDPELDESIIDMDFVTIIDVDASNRVHVEFRLPTYWCAANFAFIMAEDIRAEVCKLAWVASVSVKLGEHMYADTINTGMAKGQSFQEAFGKEADGDLSEVRRTFLLKAFQRRQEALLMHLLRIGRHPQDVIAMRMRDLPSLNDADGRKIVDRYLERRGVAASARPDDPAFVTAEGEVLQASTFESYLRSLRRVRVNGEFNGALCRGLLAVRFDTTTPLATRAE